MNIYETSDFQLAITLYTMGYRLITVDKNDMARAVFVFESDEGIDEAASAFFQDDLTLNPRAVLTNSKLVKSRLYAGI